jgi:hypothetical protein
MPPRFFLTESEVYGMSKSRNEYRELAFVSVLLALLVITLF